MLRHAVQTFIWKYDKYFASAVAILPVAWQPYSSWLGRVTLPSIWAATLSIISGVLYISGYHELAAVGFVTVAFVPLATIIKLLFRRSRPKTIYAQNMKIKSYSFPSSHAYSATIAGGFLSLSCLTLLPGIAGSLASILIVTFVVAIGLSRIHVGAHYPTDVTGAWILGGAVLYCIMRIA